MYDLQKGGLRALILGPRTAHAGPSKAEAERQVAKEESEASSEGPQDAESGSGPQELLETLQDDAPGDNEGLRLLARVYLEFLTSGEAGG